MTPEQERKIDDLLRETRELKEVIVGNAIYNRKGIIDEVKDLKDFKEQVQKLKWYSLGGVGVMAAIVGVIKFLKELFS